MECDGFYNKNMHGRKNFLFSRFLGCSLSSCELYVLCCVCCMMFSPACFLPNRYVAIGHFVVAIVRVCLSVLFVCIDSASVACDA